MKSILTFLCSLLLISSGFAKHKCPNVVTVLVDDLGYRDLGCYGGPSRRPFSTSWPPGRALHRLPFRSTGLLPSRATFLTGRNHIRAGVYSVLSEQRQNASAGETTLAEVLKDEGYGTAHFGNGIWVAVNNRDNPTLPNMASTTGSAWSMGLIPVTRSHQLSAQRQTVGPMKGYSCQIVVEEAIAWLDEKRDADAPFFINLWFNEPHAVIAAPDEIVSVWRTQRSCRHLQRHHRKHGPRHRATRRQARKTRRARQHHHSLLLR